MFESGAKPDYEPRQLCEEGCIPARNFAVDGAFLCPVAFSGQFWSTFGFLPAIWGEHPCWRPDDSHCPTAFNPDGHGFFVDSRLAWRVSAGLVANHRHAGDDFDVFGADLLSD